MKFNSLIIAALLFFVTGANAQQTHYVRSDAAGSENGTSWSNAFTSLQNALDAANSGDQVWVAAGTYRPDNGNGRTLLDRSLSFELKSGVRLHGGFAGTETSKAGRMPAVNRSILSGDLQDDDDGFAVLDDNSFHVVVADGVDDGALLEGFYVVGGNANGVDSDSLGGGIRITGGAPWIINTRFNSSVAGCGGGVAVLESGNPTIANTVVNGNRAETGGGICLQSSNPTLINSTITSNIARLAAGVYNNASSPRIDNSIIAENRSFADSGDCEVGQFPCSLGDVPEDVLAASAEIMEGARDAWLAGSIDDAMAYLLTQPSVVSAFADSLVVAARVRSGTYDYLIDGSDEETNSSVSNFDLGEVGAVGNNTWLGDLSSRSRFGSGSTLRGQTMKARREADSRNIVGEDRNNNGRVDNRDGKRALIIAPHIEGSIGLVTSRLLELEDYRGQVTFLGPDTLSRDSDLRSFSAWDDYDLIYLHTKTAFPTQFVTLYDTGLPVNLFPSSSYEDGINRGWFLDGAGPSIWISQKFLGDVYNESLTNTVIICAGCYRFDAGFIELLDVHRPPGVVVGTEGSLSESGPDNLAVVDQLSRGLTVGKAAQNVTPGLDRPLVVSYGQNAYRIREVVNLYVNNNTDQLLTAEDSYRMHDGADITLQIDGAVGDSNADELIIYLLVDGVDENDAGQIQFYYTVDGISIPGSFGFEPSGALRVSDTSWYITHTLELGFPLEKGLLPIEVLEVGTNVNHLFESRFSAIASVDAFDCVANGSISGFRPGAFSGPAQWTPGSQISILYVRSGVDFATSTGTGGPHNYEARFSLDTSTLAEGGFRFPITFGVVGHSNGLFDTWGVYHTGDNSDCPDCGGHVDIDSVSVDGTTYFGTFEFVGYDITASSGDPKPSALIGSFRALTGTTTDIRSPYFQCLMQYQNLEDASEAQPRAESKK